MRCLLDTHTLLWALLEPHKLSVTARRWVSERSNELLVSSVSAWEIATKYRLGKLTEATEVALNYLEVTEKLGVVHLAITPHHCLRAGAFPVAHKDPFDRMLAAQSLLENLPILSQDPAFALFPVDVIW